jgi:hypothetical protein
MQHYRITAAAAVDDVQRKLALVEVELTESFCYLRSLLPWNTPEIGLSMVGIDVARQQRQKERPTSALHSQLSGRAIFSYMLWLGKICRRDDALINMTRQCRRDV